MTTSAQIRRAHRLAVRAMRHAHAPYSKFYVGAAVIPKKGTRIFTGCNVENASYGATICAERVAVTKAVSEGHSSFKHVVVVTDLKDAASPCGMCVQVMSEFCGADTMVWIGNKTGIQYGIPFRDLNPHGFGSHQLRSRT